jgi:uncharacterized ferredoxin-like protein
VISEQEIIEKGLMDVAERMAIAARTAPKGCGKSTLSILIATAHDIKKISEKLKAMGELYGVPSFTRDAQNILSSPVMLLLGCEIKPLGIKKCGMCGFRNCEEKAKHALIPCVFNTGDLGIAIGSAVSVAMDARVDNRIMYTVGQAVKELGLFSENVQIIYAVPLSATSKNPFFDRG